MHLQIRLAISFKLRRVRDYCITMINPEDVITISDASKLCKDIASLYLNEKLSDITLILDKEKLHAHKVILAARSAYFQDLLYQDGQETTQTELALTVDASPDTFRNVLKFIYTGNVTVTPSDINPNLDLISLAHQCSLNDLEQIIAKKIASLLNLKNICSVLNTANLYDLVELREACHSFMDQHASEILANDCFDDLSQKSLIKLLERDTFFAPELHIFESVAKWCQSNNDVAGLVVKCVRLSCLTVVDIVKTVWPSKLVDNEDLLQAIAEIVNVKPRVLDCRAKLLVDTNVATPEHNATVLTGNKTGTLLTGNRNVNSYAETMVGDKNGFTIKLGVPTTINHLHWMLWDQDTRYYQYYIEISLDQKNWKKIIDYSHYPCRSVQNLYFEKQVVHFLRIVGTHNTANTAFHMIYFEAYFRDNTPRIVNNIVCPTTNVATVDKKATVIEGRNPGALLDGNYDTFTEHTIGAGNIMVQLAQPYMISSIKLLLWDKDNRTYKYYVETSVNKSEWTIVADHRNEENKSWQLLRFSERPVVFIRITGTSNTANNAFHLLHFECPASDNYKV